jgi:thiol-disulfide isomerase/thioredoxin
MKSYVLPLAAVFLGGVALAAGYYARTQSGDGAAREIVRVSKTQTDRDEVMPRPEFWLPDSAGVRRGIAEWDGKLLIMNFWATWCPPCLHEIPMFITLQERYGARGVQFLGIAIDDGDKVRAFAEEIGLNYPTLHGQMDAIEVMTAYGNKSGGLPFTVIVDRAGQIVARHPGVLDEAAATGLIEELL